MDIVSEKKDKKQDQNETEGFEGVPALPLVDDTWTKKRLTFLANGSPVLFLVVSIVWLCSMFYAAYLSWSCNTSLNTNIILKVINTFWAFSVGPFYIVFYMMSYHQSLCYFASRLPLVAAAATVAQAPAVATPAVTTSAVVAQTVPKL